MPTPDRPRGPPVDLGPGERPTRKPYPGCYVRLEALEAAKHAPSLWRHTHGADDVWDYLFDGPHASEAELAASLDAKAASVDPLFWAIVDQKTGDALGYATLMRIEPAHRVIEVGNILYAPALQRTRGATEAMYLLARIVFDELGYRRYEWKCNALNAPSRAAALRLGFTFEGIFRQHMIVKGRNRDTAWYSMLDGEWPEVKHGFEAWLSPENFGPDGRQLASLADLRAGAAKV